MSECLATQEPHVSSMHQAILQLKKVKDDINDFVEVVRKGDVPKGCDAAPDLPTPPLAELMEEGPGVIRDQCEDISAMIRDLRGMIL